MKTQVALYPFDFENLSVVKYFNILQDKYDLTTLISPKGYALTGKDAAFIANQPDIGILVDDTLNALDTRWSVLIVTDLNNEHREITQEKYNYIAQTLAVGKKVIYYPDYHTLITKQLLSLQAKYKSNFTIHKNSTPYTYSDLDEQISDASFYTSEISPPVILVGGLLEQADVTEVVFKLAEYLKSINIHTSVYCNSPLHELFNFKSISPLIHNGNMREIDKINYIHSIIKQNELTDYPELIIMEAPDAIMKYNDKIPNGYGILTYMLAQSVSFDYFICCMPFELTQENFIKSISSDMRQRLGCEINAVHASNLILDIAESLEKTMLSIVRVPTETVRQHLETLQCRIPVLNMVTADGQQIFNILENQN